MQNWNAVVFDLDDTLYPERQYALSGFAAVARWAEGALGIPYATGFPELKRLFESGVRGDTFNRWLRSNGQPEDPWVAEMVQIYRDHQPTLEPFADVPPVLQQLSSRVPLGLITQGHRPGQQRKLEALGYSDLFQAIVIMGEEERDHWKPATLPFERLAQQLKLSAGEMVYIGDHPERDFYGARKFGMATIRVRREGGEHTEKEPPGPEYASDFEVDDFRALHLFLATRVGV